MIKQIPTLLGYTSDVTNTIPKIIEVFYKISDISIPVAFLGLSVLLMVGLFSWLKQYIKVLKIFPPFFYALVLSSLIPLWVLLDFGALLTLPSSPLQAIVFPDFIGLWQTPSLWYAGLQAFVAIFVIGTVETCASIKAIDQLSSIKAHSSIAPTLKGVGLSGILAGLIGGVAVIPEVMRSTVGVNAGSKSKYVNFWYALFMLLGWLLLWVWLSQLPLTILAAVLIVCAYGLARPQFWKESWASGLLGFLVFSTTILLTLTYDLMLGLIVGSILHFIFAKMKK
jgi:MFS superfamily sulfate permease-like transporter